MKNKEITHSPNLIESDISIIILTKNGPNIEHKLPNIVKILNETV